ncbi:S-Ena type endospore appendage [Peribacillus alkalitolerans]|uniref:S-Ena type endospore appendage n=1 Tax=Peribacillus alkalitolerans TaxID=1550385 RepID=UPI0013D27081|nr:S-Ena type endospore appendage [Peribacillus alkalitolerans]
MCGTHDNHSGFNGFCCPDPKIFQEEICGNIKGLFAQRTRFWQVLDPIDSDYFQGTFEVFNCGNDNITFAVLLADGTNTGPIIVTPGNTRKISVNNPIALTIITASAASQGKFCITLYKRVVC